MMQIYLPFPNVELNVNILSERDLTHQRNCALTILETLTGKTKGWRWHPGVCMWWGWDQLLAHIAIKINDKWALEASTDPRTTPSGIAGLGKVYHQQLRALGFNIVMLQLEPKAKPWWWGNERFHQGNQAQMLRQEPEWYGSMLHASTQLGQWWPMGEKDKFIMGPETTNGHYMLDGKPIFLSASSMSDLEFAEHVNEFHNLMPQSKTPVKANERILGSLRALHDRFHQKRVYSTHDHR